MRSIIWLIILMVGLTVTGRSDDTLFVRSFRTINMCSSQRSALFVLDLGQMNASDSLMLFDITFSYDTNAMRPGILLKENTLGNQLNFYNGPFMNLTVPTEIRLSGFSINRVAVGNLPLIAFNAEILSEFCNPQELLKLTYTPEFNEEFKRYPSLTAIDSVTPVYVHQIDSTLGVQFPVDTISTDTSTTVSVQFTIDSGLPINSSVSFFLSNDDGYRIEGIEINNSQVVVEKVENSTAIVSVRENSGSVSGTIVLKRDVDTASATITTSISVDSCQCIVPRKNDRIQIRYTNEPTTSVDADEDVDVFQISDGKIIMQHLHEHPIATSIIDILGNYWWTSSAPVSDISLNNVDLPTGVYYVVLQTSTRLQARKFVKK